MSAVGAQTGQRQIHSFVELQFVGNDLESFGALFVAGALVFTFYDFVNYIFIYIFDIIRQILCFKVCLVISLSFH